MVIIQLGESFWVPLASSLSKLYKKEKEMKICVLCGERIEEWQLMDRTCEYVDDGLDQAVLVTSKASVLCRPFREPPEYRKLISTLSKLLP